MKLFNNFEAVKFVQENLIFITNRGYIYYIYDPEYNSWRKHRNAGNDHITVANYPSVCKEELIDAMKGLFPKKETDFMRLCKPSQLHTGDMLDLLNEDYIDYLSDYKIYDAICKLFWNSDVCHKSYLKIKDLLDNAVSLGFNKSQVLDKIKELSFDIIGRDIFKEEIGIIDGHNGSSYFWIKPVRIIDFSNTNALDTVAEMDSIEISIEEDDIYEYLTPFLYKYFDKELEANKNRLEDYWIDDDGYEHKTPITNFEWYLTHNFYTFDAIKNILKDISDTVDALLSGRKNEYKAKLIKKRGLATFELLYAKDMSEEQIKEYNANRPTVNDTKVEMIIDFYQRFMYRMEYMLRVGEEKGYNLISFMGP